MIILSARPEAENRSGNWVLESPYHARIATGPQDTTAMPPGPDFDLIKTGMGHQMFVDVCSLDPRANWTGYAAVRLKRVIVTPDFSD